MKTAILTAALLSLSAAVFTAPAWAAEDATTCRNLGKDVASAMDKASGDLSQARAEQRIGLQSCRFGQFDNGAQHYRKALDMLGSNGNTAAGGATHAPAR
jgi:hypothetical protein